MPYATQADIAELYGEELLFQLADRDRDQQLDVAAITAALTSADGQINTYLSLRYTPSQIAASADVKRLAIDIAVHRLAQQADAWTKEIRARYEDAITQLKLMASGAIGLGLPENQTPAASDVRDGEVLVSNNERVFTRRSMRGL